MALREGGHDDQGVGVGGKLIFIALAVLHVAGTAPVQPAAGSDRDRTGGETHTDRERLRDKARNKDMYIYIYVCVCVCV